MFEPVPVGPALGTAADVAPRGPEELGPDCCRDCDDWSDRLRAAAHLCATLPARDAVARVGVDWVLVVIEGGLVRPGPVALALLSALRPSQLRDDQPARVAMLLERCAQWLTAVQVAFVTEAASPPTGADAARRAEWRQRGWGREEVQTALRIAPREAAERIAVAESLTDDLDETRDAMLAGEVTYRQARVLVEETGALSLAGRRHVQQTLLPLAQHMTLNRWRGRVRRAVVAADAAAAAERRRRARRDRRVTITPMSDGMVLIEADVPAEAGVAVMRSLNRLADRAKAAGHEGTIDQRRADVFVKAICSAGAPSFAADRPASDSGIERSAADSGIERSAADSAADSASECASAANSGTGTGTRTGTGTESSLVGGSVATKPAGTRYGGDMTPLVQITMADTTLFGLDEQPAHLTGYGAIPADLARMLAADGIWQRLITDPRSGALLDKSPHRYRPSQRLADYVRTRAGTCAFAGCAQPAHRCDIDHRVRFRDGGPTTRANLDALCLRHHPAKDDVGWTPVPHEDGSITWISPKGTVHRELPPDHLTEVDPPDAPPDPFDESTPPPF